MKCEFCKKAPATVRLTQVLGGEMKNLHLCEACAADRGVDLRSPVSIADLLLGLSKEPAAPRRAPGPACPVCGLKASDFQKTGRLGCPTCYSAFAPRLTPLIRAMQRGDRHIGKTPGASGVHPADVGELKRRLEEAVAEERFEDAAELRDRIAERLAGARADPGKEPRP